MCSSTLMVLFERPIEECQMIADGGRAKQPFPTTPQCRISPNFNQETNTR
jgi:hypothetical protein